LLSGDRSPSGQRGSIALTTNKAFKQWPTIFNADSTITSAIVHRLLLRREIFEETLKARAGTQP
jgi:hypothetical protein